MFTMYAILNDSGHTVWQELGKADTLENAQAIGERHTALYGVRVAIEEGNAQEVTETYTPAEYIRDYRAGFGS